MRLIDADKVLATSFRIEGRWNLADGKMQYFEAIPVRAIENAETVDATQSSGWIPVSERLPDNKTLVLVSFDDEFITTVEYDDDWILWDDSGEPLAWQPLPEPYKED